MYKPAYNSFYNAPRPLPFYWNRVIPATLDDALTYDAALARILYTVNAIIDNQYLSVPYLINTSFECTTESIHLTGMLYQDYTLINIDQEFVINGMADGEYYINIYNDSMNKVVGELKDEAGKLYLSTEYMPMNCTTLYRFTVTGGKIDCSTVMYNDLYTHMHNIDPNAHKDLFDAVNTRIDTEIADRKAADAALQDNIDAESAARKAADTNLQNQITSNDSDITNLRNDLNTEITNRTNGDSTLDAKITQEITDRTNADTALQSSISANTTAINNHIANKNNPHSVTKEQLGLGNVPNGPFVNTLSANSGTAVSGAVNLVQGDNVTITQSGQDITISSTGGGGGTAGVSSVNNKTGAVNITAGSNVSIDNSGADIVISATGGTAGVTDLNDLSGSIDITAGTGVSVTPSGKTIAIANTGVTSVNGQTGAVSIPEPTNTTVNGLSGAVSIAGTGSANVSVDGQTINVNVPAIPQQTTVNGLSGTVNIAQGNNVTISTAGDTITISAAGMEFTKISSLDEITATGLYYADGKATAISGKTVYIYFISANVSSDATFLDVLGSYLPTGNTSNISVTAHCRRISIGGNYTYAWDKLNESGVTSLNNLNGAVTITGTGSANVTTEGNNVTVNVPSIPAATTVNGVGGAVNLVGGNGTTIIPSGQNISINPKIYVSDGTTDFNTASLTLIGSNGISVSQSDSVPGNFTISNTGVTSINGGTGSVTVTGNNGVSVNGSTISGSLFSNSSGTQLNDIVTPGMYYFTGNYPPIGIPKLNKNLVPRYMIVVEELNQVIVQYVYFSSSGTGYGNYTVKRTKRVIDSNFSAWALESGTITINPKFYTANQLYEEKPCTVSICGRFCTLHIPTTQLYMPVSSTDVIQLPDNWVLNGSNQVLTYGVSSGFWPYRNATSITGVAYTGGDGDTALSYNGSNPVSGVSTAWVIGSNIQIRSTLYE